MRFLSALPLSFQKLLSAPSAASRAAAVASTSWPSPPSWQQSASDARGFASKGGSSILRHQPSGAYGTGLSVAKPLKLAGNCSNMVIEPYSPPTPLSSYDWLTGAFYKELLDRGRGFLATSYALSLAWRRVQGFGYRSLREQAAATHAIVSELLAHDRRSELRDWVSPAVLSEAKRAGKAREDAGWARVHWALARPATAADCSLVHARVMKIDPQDAESGFVQLTLRIQSAQRFAAYDRRGQLVAGGEQEVPIVDHWVLEQPLAKDKQGDRWTVAARLSMPEQPRQAGGAQLRQAAGAQHRQAAGVQPKQGGGTLLKQGGGTLPTQQAQAARSPARATAKARGRPAKKAA